MDINSLMSALTSANAVSGLAQKTGASQAEVSQILASALPTLLSGAQAQATDAKTAAGFAEALTQHAACNTADLGSFLKGVDMADGAKIVKHLLGGDMSKVAASAAKASGAGEKQTGDVMAAAAPLLMNLLGQQAVSGKEKTASADAVGGLMTSLLGNKDIQKMAMAALVAGAGAKAASGAKKETKKDGIDAQDIAKAAALVGKLMKK